MTPSEPARPVERFGPTSGQASGYAGLGMAAFTVVYALLSGPTATGVSVALGAVFFAALVWSVVLRPRVLVQADHLVLRNSFRDTRVPLAAVEHVAVGRMLTVWAEGEKHECLGVTRAHRRELRAERRRASDESHGFGEAAAAAAAHDRARETYVVRRIRELAEAARRRAGTEHGAVRRTWAWPEVAAVTVAGAVFALSLLL